MPGIDVRHSHTSELLDPSWPEAGLKVAEPKVGIHVVAPPVHPAPGVEREGVVAPASDRDDALIRQRRDTSCSQKYT